MLDGDPFNLLMTYFSYILVSDMFWIGRCLHSVFMFRVYVRTFGAAQ